MQYPCIVYLSDFDVLARIYYDDNRIEYDRIEVMEDLLKRNFQLKKEK
jgi:hypothetical protein